jgi:hypothetical protein
MRIPTLSPHSREGRQNRLDRRFRQNLRQNPSGLFGEMLDGLADNHELEEQRVVELRTVGGAFLARTCRVSEDRLNGALKIG